MTGTLVNAAGIIVGSAVGLALKKRLPAKYETFYFQIFGLFTLLLGIKMSFDISSPLAVILSLTVGGFAGAGMKLDEKIERLGNRFKTFAKSGNDRFVEGLVTAFLLFCMGSMSIVGAIEEGFGKTSDLLLTKSIMDCLSSVMLASAFGAGVLFSFVPLLLYQGGITVLVSVAGKEIPSEIMSEITVVGGIMLIGLSFDLLQLKKIPIVNLLPALLLVGLFMWIKTMTDL